VLRCKAVIGLLQSYVAIEIIAPVACQSLHPLALETSLDRSKRLRPGRRLRGAKRVEVDAAKELESGALRGFVTGSVLRTQELLYFIVQGCHVGSRGSLPLG
jgi:hypothetical protein